MKTVGLIGALVGLSLSSCKHKGRDSDALHNFGELTAAGDVSVFWQPMTAENLSAIDQSSSQQYPSNHPMVVRLQAWSDAIHGEMLKTKPDAVPPKPYIRILRSKEVNAFVSEQEACMPLKMTVKGTNKSISQASKDESEFKLNETAEEPRDGYAYGTLSIYADGEFGVSTIRSKAPCIELPPDRARLSRILQFSLKNVARCFELAPQGASGAISATVDASCLPPDKQRLFNSYSAVRRVKFRVIPSVITFEGQLIKDFAEEEVVSVLTHELGHYYRLHGIMSDSLYGYAYQLDAHHNLGSKPKPAPQSDVLTKLGKDIRESGARYLPLTTIPNQRLHSYFFTLFQNNSSVHFCDSDEDAPIKQGLGTEPTTGSQASLGGQQDRCLEACRDVDNHLNLNPREKDEILQSFPVGPLPDTPIAKKFYRDFETKALACAEQIDPSKHTDRIPMLIAQGGLRRKIDPAVIESASTLKELLLNLSEGDLETWIRAQNNEVLSLYKRADAARLGIYTTEQEADEIGIELAARVGIDPKAAQTGFLKCLETEEKLMGMRSQIPGELDYGQCRDALRDGFTKFVPIGDYSRVHHSTCFRVYNVFREARAHESELKALPAFDGIKPDPKKWKALQQQK